MLLLAGLAPSVKPNYFAALAHVRQTPEILGPETAAPILWTTRISAFFLQENLHVHKIPRFGGGGVFWVWGGGGIADFIYGRGDFSELVCCTRACGTASAQKCLCAFFRKLEKAVAVSGVCSTGVLEDNSGKAPGKLLEKNSRLAKCYEFWDFRHRERQTCREPFALTAGTLSPPSVRGVFWNRQFQPSRVYVLFSLLRNDLNSEERGSLLLRIPSWLLCFQFWDSLKNRKRAEYCFESTVSRKRTHWASLSFGANSVSSVQTGKMPPGLGATACICVCMCVNCLSIYRSIYLSIYLYLPVNLSIYLSSIYLGGDALAKRVAWGYFWQTFPNSPFCEFQFSDGIHLFIISFLFSLFSLVFALLSC